MAITLQNIQFSPFEFLTETSWNAQNSWYDKKCASSQLYAPFLFCNGDTPQFAVNIAGLVGDNIATKLTGRKLRLGIDGYGLIPNADISFAFIPLTTNTLYQVRFAGTAGIGIRNFVEENVPVGECFRWYIYLEDDDLTWYSSYWKMLVDCCDTTLIEYYGNTDQFGFYYCDLNQRQTFRINMDTLYNPEWETEEEVYRQSNGVLRMLNESTRPTYTMQTAPIHQRLIQGLRIALMHDTVNIWSSKYTGRIVRTGSFTVENIQFMMYPLSRVNFQFQPYSFNATNDKCGSCD